MPETAPRGARVHSGVMRDVRRGYKDGRKAKAGNEREATEGELLTLGC